MADKVKPLKLENPGTGGTQTDIYPTETNPVEDYVAVKGVAFENNDDRLFDLSASGEIQWKDSVQTTYKKLNDILTNIDFLAGFERIISSETITIPERKQMIVHGLLAIEGVLIIEGALVMIG